MAQKFRIGDQVMKVVEYADVVPIEMIDNENAYCRYGGSPAEVPLNTIGIITDTSSDGTSFVDFENGLSWHLDNRELMLYRSVMKKGKSKISW